MLMKMVDCQKIVNRLMNMLGNNINIMDESGLIVASGDKDRINTIHEAARIAIREKRNIIVNEDNIDKTYKGCKKGVNIPIFYNGQIIGVVGITGDPSTVEGYGVIVKELVELMIQEDERKRFELFQSRAIKSFAKELIKDHGEGDNDILSYRAQLVDFKFDVSRVVIVVDVCFFSSYLKDYGEQSEINIQMLKQDIVDLIGRLSSPGLDFVFNLTGNRFVILKSCKTNIEEYCKKIQEQLNQKYILKLDMGIGSICERLEDYNKSYILANKIVNIGEIINPQKNIHFVKDYKLQLLLSYLTKEQKEEYLENIGFSNTPKNADSSLNDIFQSIKVYFENGMNIQATANKLFVHRNTINYRINKFEEIYGIDVTIPYNCMMVYIKINLIELK
jgi:carbohydrate diacid regulator